MAGFRLVLLLAAALALSACARRAQPSYVAIDPATGQQLAVMQAPPARQLQPGTVVQYTPPQQTYAQAPYAQPVYPQQQIYAQQQVYAQAPRYAVPQGGPYVMPQANAAYASAAPYEPSYSLDTGDRLRVVVFGQDGISNSYIVDAGGNVNLPLIGAVPARGTAPAQLAALIADKLKRGYVREPHVSVEVEAYRPFFILGEVTNPGQYAYVPNMTAETAIAIAGGFAPRAKKSEIELTRNSGSQRFHGKAPLNTPLRPGDTVIVQERWF